MPLALAFIGVTPQNFTARNTMMTEVCYGKVRPALVGWPRPGHTLGRAAVRSTRAAGLHPQRAAVCSARAAGLHLQRAAVRSARAAGQQVSRPSTPLQAARRAGEGPLPLALRATANNGQRAGALLLLLTARCSMAPRVKGPTPCTHLHLHLHPHLRWRTASAAATRPWCLSTAGRTRARRHAPWRTWQVRGGLWSVVARGISSPLLYATGRCIRQRPRAEGPRKHCTSTGTPLRALGDHVGACGSLGLLALCSALRQGGLTGGLASVLCSCMATDPCPTHPHTQCATETGPSLMCASTPCMALPSAT